MVPGSQQLARKCAYMDPRQLLPPFKERRTHPRGRRVALQLLLQNYTRICTQDARVLSCWPYRRPREFVRPKKNTGHYLSRKRHLRHAAGGIQCKQICLDHYRRRKLSFGRSTLNCCRKWASNRMWFRSWLTVTTLMLASRLKTAVGLPRYMIENSQKFRFLLPGGCIRDT